MAERKTTSITRTIICSLSLFVVLSLPSFAMQKLTTTQMRENTIRINALEIDQYDAKKVPAKPMTIVLDEQGLRFDFDKAVVKPEYFESLEKLKGFIIENDYNVTIRAYTDSIGKDSYNMLLSQRRAEAVKAKLIDLGLEESRILGVVPMGERDPIADNSTPEGRAQNRRAEFNLTPRE